MFPKAAGVSFCRDLQRFITPPFSPRPPLGEDMVPKQALQIQEDHEEWAVWTRRRASGPTAVFLVALLPVGHQYGCQGGAGALWCVHEQFCPLVPRTPAGFHAEDSDDVIDRWTDTSGTCNELTVDAFVFVLFFVFAEDKKKNSVKNYYVNQTQRATIIIKTWIQ